jgi:O-succinylbenzoic acid--CoA ligase
MLQLHAPDHLANEGAALCAKHDELEGHLFATSGTTAAPKWIVHSQDGLDWCADTVNKHLACTTNDVWGLALPEFHVGGYCLTHRAKRVGGRLARFAQRWSPHDFTDWVTKEKVTVTSLVPTQIHDLVTAQREAPPTLRLALIGGDRLEEAVYYKARQLGWPLILSYGMTETAGLIAASTLAGTGLKPLPGWDLGFDAAEALTISGPGLFKGYLTAEGLQESDRTFKTSDRARLVDDHLQILGRADDQVKILGELVDLAKIRQNLATLFPNTNFIVVPLPDERRGFELVPVFESPQNEEILARFSEWNARQPPFARLREPVFLAPWPRTALGKVDRQALADEIRNEQDSQLPPL